MPYKGSRHTHSFQGAVAHAKTIARSAAIDILEQMQALRTGMHADRITVIRISHVSSNGVVEELVVDCTKEST